MTPLAPASSMPSRMREQADDDALRKPRPIPGATRGSGQGDAGGILTTSCSNVTWCGPIAAMLVELFPPSPIYVDVAALSHRNGWFGGFPPADRVRDGGATVDIDYGLW